MSSLVAGAINRFAEALGALRRQQSEARAECEFQHPHPSHPCGRRVDSEVRHD